MSESQIKLILSNATVSQLSKIGIMKHTHYRNGTLALNSKIPTLMESYKISMYPIKISDINIITPSKGYREEEGTINRRVNVFKDGDIIGHYPKGTSIRFDTTQGRFSDDTVLTLRTPESDEADDRADAEAYEAYEAEGGFKRRRSRKHRKSHKKSHKKSRRKRRHH
jgi:hypothetical protein